MDAQTVCAYGHSLPTGVEFCPICGLATGWRPVARPTPLLRRTVSLTASLAMLAVVGGGFAASVDTATPHDQHPVLFNTGPVVDPDDTPTAWTDWMCHRFHDHPVLQAHPGLSWHGDRPVVCFNADDEFTIP